MMTVVITIQYALVSGNRRPSQNPTPTAIVTRSACLKLGEAIVRFEKICMNGTRRLDTKRDNLGSTRISVSVTLGSCRVRRRILSISRVALQSRLNADDTTKYASGF